MLQEARDALREFASEADAKHLQRFFKTGPGEYGEGDRFIGVRVPATRKVARMFRAMPSADAQTLLTSGIHEERLLALLILIGLYQRGTADQKQEIFDLYLVNTRHINNWDLVDVSAEHVVGAHLWDKSRAPLFNLARSADLWERRIAVMATFHFIKKNQFDETLQIVEMLLSDAHDLIHKAAGWMLREIGKRDPAVEEDFLRRYHQHMPRTMLRYAIEKFPEDKRRRYLLKGRGAG
ncbi:DNA alkylation repair protein [Desulfonatronum sp. SC1]|uniref:DNA alkylation repair protein n=1 Tax=Desulfonatronum sp. SC1 TaxID=2109626 RepID=UPI000D30282E|nr:DNA alkylation repair protein [Desulfonatronum sp. SC1]PTN31684.1 DNA alkylation repair protein [Desulfonatronum sp. SC1]